MDFYDEVGTVALGSRLRRLSETVTADAARNFELYRVGLDPRWFPVFHLLAERGPTPVTRIARAIGHSHASVSQIIAAMKARRLVLTGKDKTDGRVTVVRLSAAGQRLVAPLAVQCGDVREAVDELLAESTCNLWQAIAETERLLAQRALFDRVRDVRKRRQRLAVHIADFRPGDQGDYERLNREWIEQHWPLEEADRSMLEDPEGRVLAPGGAILMAHRDGIAIGTCTLLKRPHGTFELAKMAVTASEKGKGIGELLAHAVIDRARTLGARRVYLESNSRLQPALHLYRKLGFRDCQGGPSPYERCDVQMELLLESG